MTDYDCLYMAHCTAISLTLLRRNHRYKVVVLKIE